MKNIFFCALCLLSFSAIQAQTNWLIKSIDVSLGVDEDRVSGLSNDYFTDMIRSDDVAYIGPNFDSQNAYSMICENPYVRIMATIAPLGSKSTEIRVGLNGIFNRLDGVSYYSDEGFANFSTIGDEIAIESAFIKTTGIWGLRFYGGVGTNTGFAFNNRYYGWGSENIIVDNVSLRAADNQSIDEVMQISDPYYNEVELRNGMSQRLFLQGGVGFRFFKRVEVGLEGRYGYGYRWIAGAGKKAIRLQSVAFNARYYLRKQ